MKKSICISIDGVLAERTKWKGTKHFGDVLPGAREFLLSLHSRGFYITIFTTRTNSQVNYPTRELELVNIVRNWLTSNDLYFDEIYTNGGKPDCKYFVDDKAIYLPGGLGKEVYDMALEEIMANEYNNERDTSMKEVHKQHYGGSNEDHDHNL